VKTKPSPASYGLNDFFIVLVLYRSSLENTQSFKSLQTCNRGAEKIDMLVYDNSPKPNMEKSEIVKNGFHIQYVHDASNPGVSKAYNTGITSAIALHKKWVLFLDQDTTLDENILDLYLDSIDENRDISIFATTLFTKDKQLISPSKYWFKRGFSLSEVPVGKCDLKRIRPINSSVLVSTAVFKKVGLYNESIRLDFSDHEFFDRVNMYYEHMHVIPSNSFHSLSSSDETNFKSIKIRFGIFCDGARIAGKKSIIARIQYFVVCLLRATKLSLLHKTGFFIRTVFNKWFA